MEQILVFLAGFNWGWALFILGIFAFLLGSYFKVKLKIPGKKFFPRSTLKTGGMEEYEGT